MLSLEDNIAKHIILTSSSKPKHILDAESACNFKSLGSCKCSAAEWAWVAAQGIRDKTRQEKECQQADHDYSSFLYCFLDRFPQTTHLGWNVWLQLCFWPFYSVGNFWMEKWKKGVPPIHVRSPIYVCPPPTFHISGINPTHKNRAKIIPPTANLWR